MSLRTRIQKLQAALTAKREAETSPRTVIVLPGKEAIVEDGEIISAGDMDMTEPRVNGPVIITPPSWDRGRLDAWLSSHP